VALADFNVQLEGESLTLEQILGFRFRVILNTFSADIINFVNEVTDLEERANRLQVGALTENMFADMPDIFGTHTVAQFLGVVKAFTGPTESIIDGFNRVAALMDVIVSTIDSLQDFSSSDLGADYATMVRLQSESVVETLSRLTSGLDDAMRNFDGSPEQLVAIGNLAMSIRQQELVALATIDSVAKGLNTSLARLREDVVRNIEGPRAAKDILFDARALIAKVASATTPEEIAQIGQDFEALIRSMSPEDQIAYRTSTLAIIDAFKVQSNIALDAAKQAVLDSGAAIRDMVDGFADLLDPLTILVNDNTRAADALVAIAEAVTDPNPAYPAFPGSEPVGVTEAFQVGLDEQAQVLQTGAENMTLALQNGTANMAAQVASAIRVGFAGSNVQVQVVVQDQGFVTH